MRNDQCYKHCLTNITTLAWFILSTRVTPFSFLITFNPLKWRLYIVYKRRPARRIGGFWQKLEKLVSFDVDNEFRP